MRQINALLTQLDAKKRDHFEFVAKELQELQDCGKLNEVFILFFFFVALSNKFNFPSTKLLPRVLHFLTNSSFFLPSSRL